jgi:hypothetical protein
MIQLLLFNYVEYLKLCFLACCLKVAKQNNYSRSCNECGSYLDLEDVMFENSCGVCNASQGYDREVFDEYRV